MKKLLVLLLITLIVLCSCESSGGDTSVEASETPSVSGEASENSTEENYLPVGKEELLAKAKKRQQKRRMRYECRIFFLNFQ